MGKIVDIMHHGYHFEAKSILYLGLADEFHGDVVDFFATGLLECDQNRKMISYTEKGNQFLNNLFRIKDGEPNCMDAILLLLEMTGEISLKIKTVNTTSAATSKWAMLLTRHHKSLAHSAPIMPTLPLHQPNGFWILQGNSLPKPCNSLRHGSLRHPVPHIAKTAVGLPQTAGKLGGDATWQQPTKLTAPI